MRRPAGLGRARSRVLAGARSRVAARVPRPAFAGPRRLRFGSVGRLGRSTATRLGRRARGRALIAASWLLCRLPEGPLFRVADLAGDAWYRFAPDRADQARRNLARVCRALAADGRASSAVRAAATDPRALERLVRSAFRNNARYYLEVARTPAIRPGDSRSG